MSRVREVVTVEDEVLVVQAYDTWRSIARLFDPQLDAPPWNELPAPLRGHWLARAAFVAKLVSEIRQGFEKPAAKEQSASGSASAPQPSTDRLELERKGIHLMAKSLARKLPFTAPELLEEKIEQYLIGAFERGRASVRADDGDRQG